MTITAFPLAWPPGWKRTPTGERAYGRFGTTKQSSMGSWRSVQNITVAAATQRLRVELDRMAVRGDDLVLSTNLKLRLDGLPRSDQAQPADPGAAVYWNDPWAGAPRCMAIDRYTKVEMNIAALAATIEAMRAIERHGGAIVLERAFTGFTALPAPIVAGMKRDWWVVLDCSPNSGREAIEYSYRRLASKHHPDRAGGDATKMAELNQAREDALKECT
ncbi:MULTISPECIES: J domain-containing protein [Variovorax]|uniref:J domain-containing protein n=1 Tax=Variovorax TaxID=34072 RepID=UPI0028622CE0|nr:J domain-containing protein [Variovorax sp. 3319]MDR6886084.1 DnaJ-domain-containing protein 1 [Variovorax sp. 3319]